MSVPSEAASKQALRRLRLVLLRNTVQSKLAGSRFRLAMVLFCSLIFWVGLFLLFYDGFRFLSHHRMISGLLIEMLFGLFFASLFIMLIFSTGIILYAGLFASPEAERLLVEPIPPDHVFAFKFQEALFFSSWGFMLLGSPLMLAYGITAGVPWHFYLFAIFYFASFVLLPGSLGALVSLLVVNFLPRRRREALVAGVAIVVIATGGVGYRIWTLSAGKSLTKSWINNLVGELGMSQLPFWPSHWMGKGLLRATYPDGVPDAVFYLLVLWSNALFAYMVTAFLFHKLYRRGYDRTHSYGYARRRPRAWRSDFATLVLAPLPRSAQVLIKKDLLIFLRDPVQWSQVLIFTGLLAFYFLNLGRMTYYATSPYWRNLIGFFNLAVTGLLLSTFTSRFIFPLLSLEGQKFWILGLCPISRRQVLWSKFAFAAGGAGMVTLFLTLVGGYMLELEPYLIGLQVFTVAILCSGVSGIAVGLGARFPEMKEKDPSKIAAGFGGTLNLVASLLFILVVIATMALPCHLYSMSLSLEQNATDIELIGSAKSALTFTEFRFWMGVSMVISLTVGILATWLPMRLGTRAFEAMEF